MNKRIEELAEQADDLADIQINMPGEYHPDWHHVRDEKFADLIVLEMCSLMEQCQDDCDTGDASETNWGYISQLQDWIDRFKRHFNIKD